MSKGFFESKKPELVRMLCDILGEHLPPLLKIYAELAKRADPVSHSFTCCIDCLAKQLGYSLDALDAALIDLTDLHMIDIKIGYKSSTKRMIILRVY